MFDDFQICPYTGLRSFTEEESVYFKGRDEHIEQATAQLQSNKFLMVTGASGDGKSSLVYAGIIPNARAGFLKSKYTQWSVVDFRPERTPLKNLSASLAKALNIGNQKTVEAEIGYGFSALIDLYKNSSRFVDQSSQSWQNASEEERAAMKREASNLFILVDQFEEFFTNPENYYRGVSSVESNLVINVLLETARIAYEEDLPIYIVFTMRSDYIGQCTAFRGLPEYIGFSQFFVPRLNRSQLKDVIEEPAVLSGNKITRRLTERLIHDIVEDIDQLPILQHALNQIWVAANNGQEEMDLIHYAMVGGIASDELPDDDQQRFKGWFESLPSHIQNCYHQPSLRNVLDTHANKLYEMAADYYLEKTGSTIPKEEAKNIIKIIFTCLTKIDQSRAVRNRMTLREIHNIMENHYVKLEALVEVLNIFREPGNTLIRPFITEDEGSKKINESDVLDITHESLIRNWDLLKLWAKEEYNHYTTYQDFYQQVMRWEENNRSRGFLLPIGPLTYFEKWFEELNPTPYWVKRYLKTGDEKETLQRAREIIEKSKDYLKQSAKKHAVTRAVMKFGTKRLAAVFALLALILFSSFYYNEISKRKNDVVLANIQNNSQDLLESSYATRDAQVQYLVGVEKYQRGKAIATLNNLNDDIDRVALAASVGFNVVGHDRQGKIYLAEELVHFGDSVINHIIKDLARYDSERLLNALTTYIDFVRYYDHYHVDESTEEIVRRQGQLLAEVVFNIIKEGKLSNIDVQELNEGIEMALILNAYSDEEIKELLEIMSPFESTQSNFINNIYAKEKSLTIGGNQSKIIYNGLFHELAYLYASLGDVVNTWKCVEKLFADHAGYVNYRADAITVMAYFVVNDHWAALDQYAELLADQLGIPTTEVYARALDRVRLLDQSNFSRYEGGILGPDENIWYNPALIYLSEEETEQLFNLFRKRIEQDKSNPDILHYTMATWYKMKGAKIAKINEDRGLKGRWEQEVDSLYAKSLAHWKKVSEDYRKEEISSYFILAESFPRELIYLYPDYREKYFVNEPRRVDIRYTGDSFLKYILAHNHFQSFYPSSKYLELVNAWLKQYLSSAWFNIEINEMEYGLLVKLEKEIKRHPDAHLFDFNPLYLILAKSALDANKPKEAARWAVQIKSADLKNLLNLTGSGDFALTLAGFHRMSQVYAELVAAGYHNEASHILVGMPKPENKIRLYAKAAGQLFYLDQMDTGKLYLDSADLEFEKIPVINSNFWDLRKIYTYAKTMQKGAEAKQEALRLTRNMNSGIRGVTGIVIARSYAFHDQLYEAYESLPKYASTDIKLIYGGNIFAMQTPISSNNTWKEFDKNFYFIYLTPGYTP